MHGETAHGQRRQPRSRAASRGEGLRLPRPGRSAGGRPGAARALPGAGHPAGVAGGMDLPGPRGAHPGRGDRRRRTAPVPVPRAVAAAPGPGQAPARARGRRAAARRAGPGGRASGPGPAHPGEGTRGRLPAPRPWGVPHRRRGVRRPPRDLRAGDAALGPPADHRRRHADVPLPRQVRAGAAAGAARRGPPLPAHHAAAPPRRRGGAARLPQRPRLGGPVHLRRQGYIKDLLGPDASAKDFRTWRGTVLAAVSLARAEDVTTARRRQAAVREAVKRVAADLGNTPAVSRASYIDPQVIDAFERGQTIPSHAAGPDEVTTRSDLAPAERAVLELLS